MESPFKKLKRYLRKRRKLKKDFKLLLQSAVIRTPDTEIMYREEKLKRVK